MKNIIKRGFSVLLSVIMLLSTMLFSDYNIFDGLLLIGSATGGNYYMINGKPVNCETVEDPGDGNNEQYIQSFYSYVWGINYTNDFSSADNIIKNLEYNERTLNAENLRNFIKRCQPGSVLRVETISANEVSSENGLSLFIVSFDSNGFTVFERTNERKETYYTWDNFCLIYKYSTIRFIKWPNSFYSSSIIGVETDYKKPERALYFDSVSILSGDDVRWVQQKLVDAGYKVSVDGYYGKKTETEVKLFQKDFSLTVTGIVDSLTADMLDKPMKKPDEINLVVDKESSSADLSLGDILSVTWEKVDYADSYHIFMYNSRGKLVDELDRVTTNKASFVLNTAGTYIIKGYAQNEVFVGDLSVMNQKIKVHNTYTVKFVDYDGTLLNKQTVPYGQDAQVPASPKRTGYIFKGWDTDFNNVTSSLTVTAQYTPKSYVVTFKDSDGTNIGEPQKVLFGNAAIAPDDSNIAGFIGWNKDFSFVTSAMTVSAVTSENSSDLPFSVSQTSAKREGDSSGYTVNFTVSNDSDSKKIARAVISLKTTAGKFLTLTESSAFALNASSTKAMKVFVPYDKAATVVEIYIVENYRDLVPQSKVAKITEISTEDCFTDWLSDDEAPSVFYSTKDERTEYRYVTKSVTTRSYNSLAGWTLYQTTVNGFYDSGWSGYSTNPISKEWKRLLDGKEYLVKDVEETSQTYTSGYNLDCWVTQSSYSPYYRHYWNYNHGPERKSYGQWHHSKWVSVDYFNGMGRVDIGAWYGGVPSNSHNYCGYNMAGVAGRTDSDGYIYYNTSPTTGTIKYYRYKTLTPNYVYHFYKYSKPSEWSTSPITKGTVIDSNTVVDSVETRQTRRYEVSDPTVSNIGKTRTITGVLDSSLAGRQATIFIYKIGEASDYTNEYIGQTVIDENGSYKFTFKLREEPTVETGDFTVTLGIEGADSVIYLDSIKAPLAKYMVNIKDYDGTIIDTQIVNKGESAKLPANNPSRPGYIFAGWNYSNASIYEDTDIQAIYIEEEYTVVFIDWANEKFEMQTGYHYGDLLRVPDLKYLVDADGNPIDADDENLNDKTYYSTANEAYMSKGWKGVTDGMTVTQNMVITAEYDEKTFKVNFYDYDKNIIDTQTVRYGESACAPELSSDDEHIFISWNSYDFSCVTTDLNVDPIFCYTQNAEKPSANIQSGIFDSAQTIELKCETPDSRIYYSVDGGEELEYSAPIIVENTSEIYYYSCADGYNASEKVNAYYIINSADNVDSWKYPVSINRVDPASGDVTFVKTYLADNNSPIKDYVSDYSENGYSVIGYYKDSSLKNQININEDHVTEPINIYLKLQKMSYSVKFCYEDGTVIDQQYIEYLGSAKAPENVSVEDGKVFLGWNTDDYLCVTDDLTVFARIKDLSSVSSITLNKNSLITITGMNYQLVATVTPQEYADNTIVWSSSDTSVVTVDSNGLIKAVSPGKATVVALLSGDEIRTAECEIIVKANNEENITPVKGSALKVSGGKLLGVKPGHNTVSDVLAELDSESLCAYSDQGKELHSSDKMETGSTVILIDKEGKILDAVTVIVMGDINGDGLVNVKDAALISRMEAGKVNIQGDAKLAADIDSNGVVLLSDASHILSYIEGKDDILS